jgi:hypothetical protein
MIPFMRQPAHIQAENFLRAGTDAQLAALAIDVGYFDPTFYGHGLLLAMSGKHHPLHYVAFGRMALVLCIIKKHDERKENPGTSLIGASCQPIYPCFKPASPTPHKIPIYITRNEVIQRLPD